MVSTLSDCGKSAGSNKERSCEVSSDRTRFDRDKE